MYKQEECSSRYFVYEDHSSDECLMKFPADWWSRLYEYPWAMQFASANDECLDVACGVPHPFKFYLASKCKKVHACDFDASIRSNQEILRGVRGYFSEADTQLASTFIDQITFKNLDIVNLELNYEPNQFDKIYCISALEHMGVDTVDKGMKAFSNLLKEGGLVVLTIDVPSMSIEYILDRANRYGLKLVGELDLVRPQNAIFSYLLGGLHCFRILLTK